MDLATRLQQLEELVREAKSMPLSSSVLVSRDEVLQMVAEMQEALPEEIKQARWIVKDREEQRRMAMKEAIAERAEEEAERIRVEAEDKVEDMRREAEDYVDAKLAQFEIALRRILEDSQAATRAAAKTLDQVEVGRERLRAPTTVAEQRFGEPPPPAADLYDEEEDAQE
jgi:hypothetical protein